MASFLARGAGQKKDKAGSISRFFTAKTPAKRSSDGAVVKASPKRRRSETPSKSAIPFTAGTLSISGGVGSAGRAESPDASPVAMDTSADEIVPAAACPPPTRIAADLTPAVEATSPIPKIADTPASPTPDALVGLDDADEAAALVAPCPSIADTDEAKLGAKTNAARSATVIVVEEAPAGVLRQTFVLGKDPAFTFECVTCLGTSADGVAAINAWVARVADIGAGCGSKSTCVGLDVEWCAPWWRADGRPEVVETMQLYAAGAGALVISIGKLSDLPPRLAGFLADPATRLVGVNVQGDASRLCRDFGNVAAVRGLHDFSQGESLEKIVNRHCPQPLHIDKADVASSVRLSDWSEWPLTPPQVRYAAIDAVLSFWACAYLHGMEWGSPAGEVDLAALCPGKALLADAAVAAAAAKKAKAKAGTKSKKSTKGGKGGKGGKGNDEADDDDATPVDPKKKALSAAAKNSFFVMQRNRSLVPVNLGKKEHPVGAPDALKKCVVLISGVLDSFSRADFADYVAKYGGKIVKSVTKAVTHLVNDHGEVGPSKLAKCKKNGVPIVGEDVILELVRQSAPQPAPASLVSRGSGGEGGDLPKPKQLKETENFIF